MYACTVNRDEAHGLARRLVRHHSPLVAGPGLDGLKAYDTTVLGGVIYVLDEIKHAVVALDAADGLRRIGEMPLSDHLRQGIDGRMGIFHGGNRDGKVWVSALDSGMLLLTPGLKVAGQWEGAYCPVAGDTVFMAGHRHPFAFLDGSGEPASFNFPSPIVAGDWLARSDGRAWAYCASKTIFILDDDGRMTRRVFCTEAALAVSCVADNPDGGYFAVIQREDRSNALVCYDVDLRVERFYRFDEPQFVTGISCMDGGDHLLIVLSSYYHASIRAYRLGKKLPETP
jgi:hypothetical protein